jgi:hypothetical protein
MTRRAIRGIARIVFPGTLLLFVLTGPVLARTGDYFGPLYTSSGQIEFAQRTLQGEDLLKPGRYTSGRMDQATIDALRAFQRSHFIPNSGLLDHETMAQLSTHEAALRVARHPATGAPERDAAQNAPPSGAAKPAQDAAAQETAPATRGAATADAVPGLRSMPATAGPVPLMTVLGAVLLAGGVLLARRGRV